MKKTLSILLTSLLPVAAYGQSGAHSSHTIRVDCSSPSAQVRTITAALSLIGDARPAVLLVSGTCHENVVIQSLDRIIVQGNPAATIDGGTDPNVGTIFISDSKNIELADLTITGGGGQGVGCFDQSLCRLSRLTIQNSLGNGVAVGIESHANIVDTVVQNNGDVGLRIAIGASANTSGVSIVGNASGGIVMAGRGVLTVFTGRVTDNGGEGIFANFANFVRLDSATVTGNAGDGVALRGGSTARILNSNLTNNSGHQARIGDLSFIQFIGAGNTVSGANSPDVVCDPAFSTTRGIDSLVGATTNCPAELAPAP